MSVALIHYHLRRGGVTRVLEAQSQALRMRGIDHVILAGTRYRGEAELPVEVIPALDYQKPHDAATAAALVSELLERTRRALGKTPSLWHIHNPTLGKNAYLPDVVQALARAKHHLLLQFHDFAEDGRPGNYQLLDQRARLYPLAPQIHYATINSRDRALLVEAGVPRERTALLPNAVIPPRLSAIPRCDPYRPPTVLYPARGIRRKNLGEFCLLSSLAPDGVTFALTLAPENPQWRPTFDQWKDVVRHFQLPVQLGVVGETSPAPGVAPTYENWLAHSSHLATTSVAEGFGLAFLEPIALELPLLGRDLPEITGDFKQHHLHLGDLYEHLLIPADWVDTAKLLASLRVNLRKMYHSYGVSLPNGIVKETHRNLTLGDFLDFANLPEELQRGILPHAYLSPDDVLVRRGGTLHPAAKWLEKALAQDIPASPPSTLDRYSVAHYADTLATLYRTLERATPAPPTWLNKSRVLAQFLKPERFHFLRT